MKILPDLFDNLMSSVGETPGLTPEMDAKLRDLSYAFFLTGVGQLTGAAKRMLDEGKIGLLKRLLDHSDQEVKDELDRLKREHAPNGVSGEGFVMTQGFKL